MADKMRAMDDSTQVPLLVFISHATEDKVYAREYGERLAKLGVETWIDEAELNVGDAFPDHLRRALGRASHLLVLLTPRWFEKFWTREEVRLFLELRGADTRALIPVALSERIDYRGDPHFDGRAPLDASREAERDAIDWQLWCALHEATKGARSTWAERVRRVQLGTVGRAEFSNEDFLRTASAALKGQLSEVELAHLGWHALRLGLGSAWLDEVWRPEAQLELWGRALGLDEGERRPADGEAVRLEAHMRPRAWEAFARARAALASSPYPENTQLQAQLLKALVTASSDAEARAIVELLRGCPLLPSTVTELRRWMDPDYAGSGAFVVERSPQALGFRRTLGEALQLLSEQPGADPCAWFAGFGSSLELSDVGDWWWRLYFRVLLAWAQSSDACRWPATVERLEQVLEQARELVTSGVEAVVLPALGGCLVQLESLPEPLNHIVQQLLARLRHRRDPDSAALRVELWRTILPTRPMVVFTGIGGALDRLEPWDQARRAAALLGSAAQEPESLAQLMGRFARNGDPEQRALLFAASLESPSEVPAQSVIASGVDPVTQMQCQALLAALSTKQLQTLQARVEDEGWEHALATLGPSAARLALFVLAREFAANHDDPERCWRGLGRCTKLLMISLADEAEPYIDADATRGPPRPDPEQPLDAYLLWWSVTAPSISGTHRGLLAAADALDAQLRWLDGCIRQQRQLAGRIRQLALSLRDWFIAVPELAGRFMLRKSDLYRHSPTMSPAFVALRLLIEHEEIGAALAELHDFGSTRVTQLRAAITHLARLDEAAQLAHELSAVELTMRHLTFYVRAHPELEQADACMWALLSRSFAVDVGHEGFADFERRVVEALVRCYASAPQHLLASIGPTVRAEIRAELAQAGLASNAPAYASYAVEIARFLSATVGADPVLAALLSALEQWQPRGQGVEALALELLQHHAREVREAASSLLLAASQGVATHLAVLRARLGERRLS